MLSPRDVIDALPRPNPRRSSGALPTFAAVLGLPYWPCTPGELKEYWRVAARMTHPDAGGSTERFTAARSAYEEASGALIIS